MAGIHLTSPRLALISGATGFIGRMLCQQLREQCVQVRGGMRHVVEGPWDEVVLFDLATQGLPEDALAGVDTVFHLAGKAHALCETRQDEEEYFRINTTGTGKLLEAAKGAGVRRFVFISSVKAMDEGGDACQNESEVCHPETPYGKSKLAAERLVLEGGYVPEPVVLRLSMVYGPSGKGNLFRMIEAVAKGRFPPLPELGNKRSMVHVEDVIRAALLAAEKPAAVGQTYIVTDGQFVSTRQMYDWICEALDKPVPAWTIPIGVLKVLAKVGDGIGGMRGRRFLIDSDALAKLMNSACYSSEKIQRELGFRPARDLRSALPEIVRNLGIRRAGDQRRGVSH
jgi:nucleoside-diphosphate-sugar epimerase